MDGLLVVTIDAAFALTTKCIGLIETDPKQP
jgi:hypothetical protein